MRWVSNGNDKVTLFNDTSLDQASTTSIGNYTGAVIETNSSIFEIYIGISYISYENAKLNLQTEVGDKKFDEIKSLNKAIWHKQFSRFEISAISEDYQTKIDTAIYRTLLTPTIFNDVNG